MTLSLLFFSAKMLGQTLVTKQTGPQGKVVGKVSLLPDFLAVFLYEMLEIRLSFRIHGHGI